MNAIFHPDRTTGNSNETLNAVARMHARTLASYLLDARPADALQYPDKMETIRHIAIDQQETVQRLDIALHERGLNVNLGGFPMEFTSLHDLSMAYLLRRLIEQQRRNISQLEEHVKALRGDPKAQAIVEEALGAAKAHLDALQDCQASE